MKLVRSFAVGVVLALWAAFMAGAQPADHVVRLDSGFVHGDARQVLEGAAPQIEMALLGQSRQYSRAQAVLRLRQFFRERPPASFVWSTQEVDGEDWFAAGRYEERISGMAFRMYAYWKCQEERWVLATLHVFE